MVNTRRAFKVICAGCNEKIDHADIADIRNEPTECGYSTNYYCAKCAKEKK